MWNGGSSGKDCPSEWKVNWVSKPEAGGNIIKKTSKQSNFENILLFKAKKSKRDLMKINPKKLGDWNWNCKNHQQFKDLFADAKGLSIC